MLKTKIDGWFKDRIWRESLLSMRQTKLKCKTLPKLNLMSQGGRFCLIVQSLLALTSFSRVHTWIKFYSLPCSWMQPYAWSGQCKRSRAMRATWGLAHKHLSSTILHILFLCPLSDWVKRVPNRQEWVETQDRTSTGPSMSRRSTSPTSYTNANWTGMWLENDLQYINKLRFWSGLL